MDTTMTLSTAQDILAAEKAAWFYSGNTEEQRLDAYKELFKQDHTEDAKSMLSYMSVTTLNSLYLPSEPSEINSHIKTTLDSKLPTKRTPGEKLLILAATVMLIGVTIIAASAALDCYIDSTATEIVRSSSAQDLVSFPQSGAICYEPLLSMDLNYLVYNRVAEIVTEMFDNIREMTSLPNGVGLDSEAYNAMMHEAIAPFWEAARDLVLSSR